jgi:hypothetical protein
LISLSFSRIFPSFPFQTDTKTDTLFRGAILVR